ncbi:MAG: deoxyribose-phosphate aldolase [Alphaproteobacteria bacterium]|nr:deoxyribose-phosphate aldolase [Alphaproteobacteria bacterium]
MDDVTAAKLAIKLLDLTSLNKDDTESKIEALCKKAVTPYGNVAAVCVYPRFIPFAIDYLKGTGVKTATVVNFPEGKMSIEETRKEIQKAINFGSDEIDAVFPYQKFMAGDFSFCKDFLKMVTEECGKKHVSKIILETGELKKLSLIIEASKMCINFEIDFLKTSTGKTEVSATPEVANAILETISTGKKAVGFKASGGIKTAYDVKKYLILANSIMGSRWISPKNLRIGASSVLDDLIKTIETGV